MNKIKKFFQEIKNFDNESISDEISWFHDNKKTTEGSINLKVLRDLVTTHNLNYEEIAAAVGVVDNSLRKPFRSSLMLRICDALDIPFQSILTDTYKNEVVKKINSNCSGYTLTAYIELTQEQVVEIIDDFMQHLELNYTQFSQLINASYYSIYSKKPSVNVFDCLVIYYDLRGSNFKHFLEYLEEKKWFNPENLKEHPIINKLLNFVNEQELKKIKILKLIDSLLDEETKRPDNKVYKYFTSYKKIPDKMDSKIFTYFAKDDLYSPTINKDDFLVIRKINNQKTVDDTGLYLIATRDQYLNNEYSYLFINPINKRYSIEPIDKIFTETIVDRLDFFVIGEVLLVAYAENIK